MYAIALVLLFASSPQEELKRDVPQPQQQGAPTDPLFDKAYVATDEPAFVLSVIESARQGELDARNAAQALSKPELRDAASRIGDRLYANDRGEILLHRAPKDSRAHEKGVKAFRGCSGTIRASTWSAPGHGP